jgi:hypothetical protein
MEQPVSSELHHSVKQRFKRLAGRTMKIVALFSGKGKSGYFQPSFFTLPENK